MSITKRSGNIFDTNMTTIVNPVNCIGVMGKGLALEFKKRYPNMFKDYYNKCLHKRLKVGEPYLYKEYEKHILNFPTKNHWNEDSKIKYIVDGLNFLLLNYKDMGITSISFPLLGTGCGNLKKEDVLKIMENLLNKFEIPVEIVDNGSK